MENLLVDYFMAKSLSRQAKMPLGEREYNTALYTEAVLKRHGVTQAEFDSSLVYYYTRADRFEEIIGRVSERLDEQALVLGASEGEIGKYAHYNANGDTANIWADRKTAVMMPMAPYNRWEFRLESDSTFRRGDALMMMFTSDYMYQSGEKNGLLYIATEYEDTVVSRSLRFMTSGVNQLRVPEDTLRKIRAVKGFFYLYEGKDRPATTRLLFLNNVQLIRFHTGDYEDNEPDSLLRTDATGLSKDDTLSIRQDTLSIRQDTLSIRQDSLKIQPDSLNKKIELSRIDTNRRKEI